MSALTLGALGIFGGGLLIAVAVVLPGRVLSRPEPDPLPADDPAAGEEAGA